MEFFNPKEDVLHVEMTRYGKYLLSKGKFRPSHYLFFDEGVVYDANYGGISTEKQKQTMLYVSFTCLYIRYMYYTKQNTKQKNNTNNKQTKNNKTNTKHPFENKIIILMIKKVHITNNAV